MTMLIGFWIRNSLPESLEFITENARRERKKFFEIFINVLSIFKTQPFNTVFVFSLVCFGVSTTMLVYIYAPIYMATVNHIHNTQAFIINSFSLVLLILIIPISGLISDYLGRPKTIFIGSMTLLLFAMPYFRLLSSGSFYQVLFGHILAAIPCACIFAATPVLITEIFPLSIRCSTTNLIYSLASCLGGGITPLVAFRLAENANYSPGSILVMLGGINILLIWTL
ncbi:MAG: MFS transporter [Legionella sp.]|nr:MFS transporter [Legionella sp.]